MMYRLLGSVDSPADIKALNIDELVELCQEIRDFILKNVSKSGGHLASNMGVVELTVALHYVFNSPFDRIVWDVGHQTYVHKILTRRKEVFHSLRSFRGLSGFPKRCESVHDVFETGHSSTSISAALGIARARDLKGEDYHVIAVIGDGALTGGMALEAMNDAGHSKTDLIVILNDNQMSISENVGALSVHLSKIRSNPGYRRLKEEAGTLLNKIPFAGRYVANFAERIKNSFKYLLVSGIIFEEMGFTYIGPVDGHNLPQLISVMKQVKKIKGPVLLHVITRKGKGYSPAEEKPELFHSVPPFIVETGEFKKEFAQTYSSVFGKQLIKMAKEDPRIVAITAAMPEGTGLLEFKRKFPQRFFDVGIAEQHAVTMAAGLASNGFRPFVAIYSTFLQRAYDQILHDVCLQKLPVVFAIDRAGLVGEDGETHHGVFDISFLRHMPNITIMAPKDMYELAEMLTYSMSINGPVAIRYPKGCDGVYSKWGRRAMKGLNWEIIRKGRHCCIIAVGRMVNNALEVAEILKKENIEIEVVNARVIKPLDRTLLSDLARRFSVLITVEDNVVQGGFGSSVGEFINQHRYPVSVINIGIPDRFIPHGTVEELFRELHLNADGIALQIKDILKNSGEESYGDS